jgi:hypothetical protein
VSHIIFETHALNANVRSWTQLPGRSEVIPPGGHHADFNSGLVALGGDVSGQSSAHPEWDERDAGAGSFDVGGNKR